MTAGAESGETQRGAPEGWSRLDLGDPFLVQNGPLYVAEPFEGNEIEPARFGFRVGRHNCSFAGICHGGLIASVLDISLGRSMAKLCDVPHAPTVSLTIDFMRAAKLGDWIESRVRILRRTRSMVFCDGILIGPEGNVAHASAVFKIL